MKEKSSVMLIIFMCFSCPLKWISSRRVLNRLSKKVKANTDHKVQRLLAGKTAIQILFKNFPIGWALSEVKLQKNWRFWKKWVMKTKIMETAFYISANVVLLWQKQ